MKKAILFLSAILCVILMSSMVYADSGESFHFLIMNSKGTTYYTKEGAGDVKLPDEIQTFYVTDNYIYYTAYDSSGNYKNLYRCNKDFSQKTLFTNCNIDNVVFYNNSIYYTSPENNKEVLYSIYTDTLEIKKHLTYTGYIEVLNVSNNYIYFFVSDDSNVTKLYRMNIYDNTDKKLIYLSKMEHIYECISANNKTYIDTSYCMRIVDNSTGQLLNSVSYGYTMYYLAGQADGTVYLYDGSGKIYYIDENNNLQFLAEGTYITNRSTIMGENISNNSIYLYAYDFDNENYKIYEYSIPENKFTEIN